MLWIGITGPMGSGKSTVAAILRELGYDVLDADRTVAEVTAEAAGEILAAFGTTDRRAIAAEVFARPDRLATLEGILHPRVRARVTERRAALEVAGRAAAFYDVPLLFEKKMESDFDHILVVSAPAEVRLARAIRRTGLSAAEIEARWANQLSPEYKEARASAVIRNDGDADALRRAVGAALAKIGLPPGA